MAGVGAKVPWAVTLSAYAGSSIAVPRAKVVNRKARPVSSAGRLRRSALYDAKQVAAAIIQRSPALKSPDATDPLPTRSTTPTQAISIPAVRRAPRRTPPTRSYTAIRTGDAAMIMPMLPHGGGDARLVDQGVVDGDAEEGGEEEMAEATAYERPLPPGLAGRERGDRHQRDDPAPERLLDGRHAVVQGARGDEAAGPDDRGDGREGDTETGGPLSRRRAGHAVRTRPVQDCHGYPLPLGSGRGSCPTTVARRELSRPSNLFDHSFQQN